MRDFCFSRTVLRDIIPGFLSCVANVRYCPLRGNKVRKIAGRGVSGGEQQSSTQGDRL